VAFRGQGQSGVLAGSCSARTLEQVAAMVEGNPSWRLDALAGLDAPALAEAALAWFDALPPDQVPLIYSSLPPDALAEVQQRLGAAEAAALLEEATGLIARGLVARGVRRLVLAGGETSGAVLSALGVTAGTVGDEAAPGVPWIFAEAAHPLALLLKSGNFGDRDLLVTASGARKGNRG
jgi:3-dehydrotetronate 4-kinase